MACIDMNENIVARKFLMEFLKTKISNGVLENEIKAPLS